MCLDALVTFGVIQVPKSDKNGNGLGWRTFKSSALLLIEREKTGHAARDEILELMDQATSEEWNDWYSYTNHSTLLKWLDPLAPKFHP